jgi:hypothetical protein
VENGLCGSSTGATVRRHFRHHQCELSEHYIGLAELLVLWGSNFSIGGNLVFWRPASGGQTVTLSENDGLYFWDQSGGRINATLDPRITLGLGCVSVENSCILQSGALQTFAVTVN